MQCVYLIAQRGQESLVISLRVLQNTVMIVHFPCSLGVHLLLFLPSIFPGSIQIVVCTVYTV